MLWNYIIEFYIKQIFGGILHGEYYGGYIGTLTNGSELYTSYYASSVTLDGNRIALGNYLSLIATIITIVAIVLFCVFIIKKIIGIIFRLFTGSSSF